MPKFNEIKKVYHGTTSNYAEQILRRINIKRGSPWADFGQGFYTTSSFIQALNWARKRRDWYNLFNPKELVDGIIMSYKLDVESLVNLNGLIFNYQSHDWARFIHKNRSEKINFSHDKDFVYGSVADGKIDELISSLDSGIINMTNFKQSIDSKRYGFNDQLSFHTELSTQCLKFIKEVKYDDQKKASN